MFNHHLASGSSIHLLNRAASRTIYEIIAIVILGMSFFCCHPVLGEEEERFERVVEELFFGSIIYPQDQGELQLSTGFRSAQHKTDDFRQETCFEYGITDRFQIGAEFPVDFLRSGPEKNQGLGNVELEFYYNFYNNQAYTHAYGLGFATGLPTVTPEVGEQAMIYEPYFVAFHEFKPFYFNFYAGIEVADSLSADEESQVGGNIALAVFKKYDRFVLDLEFGIEIEKYETPIRLAPALFWHPRFWEGSEFAVSLPIGLTGETPNLGVFLMITKEYGGN